MGSTAIRGKGDRFIFSLPLSSSTILPALLLYAALLPPSVCVYGENFHMILHSTRISANALFVLLVSVTTAATEVPSFSFCVQLGDSIAYLEAVKSSAVTTMEYLWADNYLPEFDTVFDSLFTYMENGILRRDLCNLEKEYRSAYFEAYLLGFKSVLVYAEKSTAPLSNDNFRDCFYGYFVEVHGDAISDLYHNLMQRYNMLLRYLQALDTSDQALKSVLDHALSAECQDSLLRMTHCAQCAGVSNTSVLPCKNLCQNVQQGCLVDIYELGYVYKELYDVMDDANDVLNEYNPLAQMQSLAAEVLKMLDDFKDGYEHVANIVS